ncbi:MAG: hypothetical protein KAR42_00715 [candidate division Zixibacteria bacterium]|nr:hypothetical protein [candidate division Zixibacteria bacterium]
MSKTRLRLMSMNLENLFSPGENFYGKSYTVDEYKSKIKWIASIISSSVVHCVAVTELGSISETCITDIIAAVNKLDEQDNMTAGDINMPPFAHSFAGEPGRGSAIRNGIISRFPISKTGILDSYPDDFVVDLFDPQDSQWKEVPSSGYSRPVTFATITPPHGANPFNMFVVHLKSKRPRTANHDDSNIAIGTARSAIQRNIEAAALRYYFDEFLPDQYDSDKNIATFVMGDFNDTPTSVPAENIRGSFDTRPGPASPWSGPDKKRLLNCARLHLKFSAYEDKLFSYVHNESFTLIDHIFVSEHLVSKFKRMEIFNDHVFRHQEIKIDTDIDKQWKSTVSDHGVIVIELNRMLKT